MVTASIDKQGYTGHILLQPNLSLSWQTNKTIIIFLGVVSLCIGVYFSLRGFWVVLPFSGLEVLVFALSIYYFFSRNMHCEVVTFTDDKVVIQRGKTAPEKSYEYQRHWSQIYIKASGSHDIPKVSIKSHGKELELGSFLGYDEKMQLIETLKKITSAFRSSKAFRRDTEQ